jgi:MoaA/NifB/PqqE/SkfB family radical SAM enzyme
MSRVNGLYSSLQRRVISEMLNYAARGDTASIVRAFQLAEKITPASHKGSVRFATERVREGHPGLIIARHVSTRLSPKCRDGFINCLIVNTLLRGLDKRQKFMASTGMNAPTTILMSPTMRCNLACPGCFAGEYAPDNDLDLDLLQKIVDEGNDMGVYLFTLLGGEPFIYDGLLEFAERNKDAYFQIFTNGTLLDHETVARIARIGNIAPMLSIEGDEAATDARRGRGRYRQLMAVMDDLREAGVLFGCSYTVTRDNWRTLVSDEYVEHMVQKGAMLGWHFLYMPIGRDPSTEPMLTPDERNEFREGILRMRATHAMFPIDFWGDAPYVNGCIAGKHYMHINSEGWVEPCIFTHFATDNIRDTSLAEAFNSPYFHEIRRRQPFSHNLLKPCMLIDNPEQSREIMVTAGARPTHPGAESLFTSLRSDIDEYAEEVERVYAPVWSCMQHEADDREPAPV